MINSVSLCDTGRNYGINFKGLSAVQKSVKPILKNGVDTFEKTSKKESEGFLFTLREVLGEMFPELDPEYRKMLKISKK